MNLFDVSVTDSGGTATNGCRTVTSSTLSRRCQGKNLGIVHSRATTLNLVNLNEWNYFGRAVCFHISPGAAVYFNVVAAPRSKDVVSGVSVIDIFKHHKDVSSSGACSCHQSKQHIGIQCGSSILPDMSSVLFISWEAFRTTLSQCYICDKNEP